MSTVLVLYYSRGGSTRELAQLVANGIESVAGAEAKIRTVPSVSPVNEAVEPAIPHSGDAYAETVDLEQCDALVLGSPTRFGTVAAPIQHFFDQTTTEWLNGALRDKPAGVFTSSSSLHGGQESTLLSMMLPLIHHGMIMVGIPFGTSPVGHTSTGGTPYGASHVAGTSGDRPISADEREAAMILGRRVANVTEGLASGLGGKKL